MQQFKRVAAMLLCLVMLVSCLPVGALAAETTGEVVDAAVIFSDLHTSSSNYKESTLKGIMTALKNTGLPISSVTSAGDAFSVNEDSGKYTGYTSTLTGYIQDVLGNVPVNYVWSDHDRYAVQADDVTLLSKDSGFVYGAGQDGLYGTDDDASYYIYSLSMMDMTTNDRYGTGVRTSDQVAAAIDAFTAAAAELKQDRPLFIASHQPLLDRRDDNGHAYAWATAINAVAEDMDVAFFFGHNHRHDVAKDYYYAKGETMSVCSDSSGSAVDVELNFTHISAGYMAPASTGSTSSTTRQGVAVAITIYEDAINYTTYNASGVYTGNYALNETVAREHAKAVTTAPEVVEKTDETTGITVAAPGITGVHVTVKDVAVPAGYSAYASYDINLDGYTDGDTATVTIPAPAGFDAAKPVLVLHEGEVIATTAIADGKITFTTDHFSVYDVAQTAEGDLEWIEISKAQDKTIFRLTNSLESGKKYVIVSRNTAGNGNAVNLSGTSINSASVTVNSDADGAYIDAPATTAQWTYSSSRFANVSSTSRYLRGNNSALGTTTSTSSSYTTWDYSANSYGLRTRYSNSYNSYRYMTSVTTTSSSSSNTNRVYIYVEEKLQSDPLYAAMEGQTEFRLQVGSYDENTIRNVLSVYTATDANGTGKAPTNDYQLVGDITGSTAGTYTLSVQYGGKELGKVTVVMASDPYLKITENGEEKELIFKKNAKAGDTVQLGVDAFNGSSSVTNPGVIWEIPEEYAGNATVDSNGKVTFQVDRANFLVKATWTVAGKELTDTIQIIITPDNYLTPGTSTNDFPEYPNEGAIRYDKTAEAVGNFSETGVAQLELSMTGIPFSAPKKLDVVLMLDHSNSMTEDRMSATRTAVEVFVNNIVKNADGSFNGNRIYIGSFAGGNPDYAGQSRHEFRIYQMTAEEEDGFQIVNDQDELDALIAEINSTYVKFSSSTAPYGTEYDQSLEDCYNVLNAVKSDGNQQFCVFMSDGIPNVYRYGAGANDKTTSSSAMAAMFASSGNTKYATRGSSYKYEYWSSLMKQEGVTVFSVGLGLQGTNSSLSGATAAECERVSNMLLNDISGPAGETASDRDTGNAVTKKDKYFFSVADANAAEDMKNVFTNIASQIMMAATDIVVTDKVTEEYTMIFGIPQTAGTDADAQKRNEAVQNALADKPLYIEVVNYTLDAKHERTGTPDTLTRIYLKDSNGATAGGTYSAATDANGTAAAAPAFTAKTEGKRGYWSVFTGTAGADDIVITVGGTTWKFMEKGDGTHNVTSGAYAYGTIDAKTNMSEDLVIVTPYFAYSAKTRMLAWTADKVEEFKELALRYFLYLNDSSTEIGTIDETAPGTYPTNEWAYITYTNHLGNDCRREFPVPQMTWNGAQVSYVFYLVNEKGEPINKAGERVDFANATFITDVFTEYVVWNDTDTPTENVNGEGVAYLDAKWQAQEKLPEGYTLYDGKAYYELKVYEDHQGNVLDNYFKIDGSEANGSTESSTKVYNTKAGTKYSAYGTYNKDNVASGFDFANTTVAFAVVWKLQLNPDTVVVDYGLDVLVNVVENDLISNTLTGISKTVRPNLDMNTAIAGNPGFTAQTLDYTDYMFSVEGENQIRFNQKDMQFREPVTMYYETKSTDYINGTARTGYMYSSLTVIPATTIYYEDEYVELKTYEVLKNEDGTIQTDDYDNPIFDTVGTSGWDTNSVAASAVQQQDRPGESQISAGLDADNNYGYDAAYTSMSSHSMNNAAKINVNAYKKGEATFTFYGTGFDIISVTSNMTGTLMVQVTGTTASGAAYRKNLMVDTYYGYTQNADGEWVTSVNDPNALWQVPVIKLGGLEYGQYTVKLVAAYSDAFAHNSADNYDLYLDAIRIYDPTGNNNDVANNAYKADGEGWPIYKELRNLIIDDGSFGSYLTVDSNGSSEVTVNGVVFIDSDDATSSISAYTSYGPNNELYLAPGQAVAFEISDAFVAVDDGASISPVKVQLAVKTTGGSADVEIFNPSIKETTTEGTTQTITKTFVKGDLIAETISTATDMYYDITALTDDVIVISNPGEEGILSITNLKFTFEEAAKVRNVTTTNEDGTEQTGEASVASISEEGAVYSLRSLRAYSVSETTEVETEPETEPETEVTEPETEPETEATEPETEETTPATTEPESDDSGSGSGSIIGTIIKKLFGWLFG